MTIEELQYGDEIPVAELLAKARAQLDAFAGTVHAVIGFWDFPVSTMIPLLAEYVGTHAASLRSVVKCEHKYWSRLEQQRAIAEYPPFGVVDPDHDQHPPTGVGYPMWVKPVKSFSSDLAFGVEDQAGFAAALARIREGIGRIGEPFEFILDQLDLPEQMRGIGGRACLAEETVTGQQVTLEGYVYGGETRIFGVVDTINRTDVPSEDRYQYPSSIPVRVADRMAQIACRILGQVGLDMTTFNIEFFYDRETDTIRVLEVNPRHSQSHAELFEQVDGAANHETMLELALGRQPSLRHRRGQYPMAAKWFLRRLDDGIARRVPTRDELIAIQRTIPGVTVDVIINEGTKLSALPDQDSYSYKLANLYIGADNETELHDKFNRCTDTLRFEFDHPPT
ncbi:ATP-grasp domain-containing protein [Sciscionella marina]|uniref:ATP-grasp domain-containing protein n=1 Tax=Sciscionella marina TaxID=508770 RepID=UPI0003615E26